MSQNKLEVCLPLLCGSVFSICSILFVNVIFQVMSQEICLLTDAPESCLLLLFLRDSRSC